MMADYVRQTTDALLPALLTILAGVLTTLGYALHRWLAARLRLESLVTEEARDRLADRAVALAVDAVEQLARRAVEPMSPDAKRILAIDIAASEMRRHGLPELARDRLVEMIEAWVSRRAATEETDR